MRRLQGGRHRDPSESRRRTFLTILATFGLATAATSLWALDTPLDGVAASTGGAPATAEATSEAGDAAAVETLAEFATGEADIRPQEPEEAPTTETPEETSEAPPSEDEGDSGDGGGGGQEDSSPHADLEAAVADLADQERGEAGCGSLERDSRLDAAARLHAEDMAANDYFSHDSQDGRSPTDRANAQGFEGGVGENIAMGYPDAAAAMEGWMNSEGHRANILNCEYDVIGIGVADRDGTLYWVQNFG
ncbi:CAP domain-containing protein [Glycomyces sp. TRM65418]|uniref:CAP domain-containing protein n=1 Tax=Glycomyces sp. TRM65418 TaxID=2867006 RepID=UPI001CE5C5CA|nr:CAP domain-containing protein [Glycomyces sp. TRM65418]MCC3764941.1 CAP domain-containing protein [Glycomyces sp. TRM65418]QZD54579.1 CAP domain-containing protein [Glycomyces sp. TRM65418]